MFGNISCQHRVCDTWASSVVLFGLSFPLCCHLSEESCSMWRLRGPHLSRSVPTQPRQTCLESYGEAVVYFFSFSERLDAQNIRVRVLKMKPVRLHKTYLQSPFVPGCGDIVLLRSLDLVDYLKSSECSFLEAPVVSRIIHVRCAMMSRSRDPGVRYWR